MWVGRPMWALLFVAAAPIGVHAGSLYQGPGPRPGPDLLYATPAAAPELENVGVWAAAPILVSGASAYRAGEFLYQDFLYDDHGALEQPDPTDPRATGNTFSRPNGTYTYPTDPIYANDAADLVELRVKPLATATAFRVTLNTLKDASRVAFSIAIGGTVGMLHNFPAGANVQAPADLFLTVHPSGASMVGDLTDATTGLPVGAALPVTVDMLRRQLEVQVPHTAWDPTGQVVRLAAGVGLWDGTNARYLPPQAAADATHPGGSGTALNPPAFFNVAFRYAEPLPDVGDPSGTATSPAWWRDKAQGAALAAGDLSPLHADVDFTKLAAALDDDMPDQPGGVPQSGPMDRILASHFEPAQGADFSVACFPGATNDNTGCLGQYQGNLQPYAIYVPHQPQPPSGYGMTLLLHSLSAPYNQYLGSRNQSQYGERGDGSIVITPLSRGPDGFYVSYGAADVFEVWADVASRYVLDPDWTVITGYSMGGIGTFRLGEQFPDLFARAQSTVGDSPDNNLVPSLRNIPVVMWNMSVDELVPAASYLPTALALDGAGYRYELDIFSPGEHLTLAINDQFAPAAAFLDLAKVDRNPAHVTYVIDPSLDDPTLQVMADHVYWLSGIQLRDSTPPLTGGHAEGTVDARSEGFGTDDPTPSSTQVGAGTLTGGNLPALAFTSQSRTWGPVPSIPIANVLHVTLTNIGAVHADVARAALDPNATLTIPVSSDGDATLALDAVFPPDRVVFEDGAILPGGSAGPGGATVPVKSGAHTYVIAAAPACPPAPAAGCRRPVTPHGASLQLRRVPGKNRLLWKWTRGAATTTADFGNPLATTGYGLCVYDGSGTPLESASAPAGGSCGGSRARPCWRATTRGYRYVDPDRTPSGLRQISLTSGGAGKAKIAVKGQGALLALPTLPISHLPLTVQLLSSDGVCWEATYSAASRNGPDRFAAKSN